MPFFKTFFTKNLNSTSTPVSIKNIISSTDKFSIFHKKIFSIGFPFLLLGIYIAGVVFFQTHFFPNSKRNNIDISYQDLETAEKNLQKLLEDYQLQILSRENEPYFITSSDINIKYVLTPILKKELESQNTWAWPITYFIYDIQNIDPAITLDETLLSDKLSSLPFLKEDHFKPPMDAYISEYIYGSGYHIVPEYMGTTLNIELAKQEIHAALNTLQKELNLETLNLYQSPKIFSDNETLVQALEQMNRYTKTNILYVGNIAIDGNISSNWIHFDGNQVYIDDNKIREFVIALADQYDTVNRPRKFKTSAVGEVELPPSKFGWLVDQEAEFQQIRSEIELGTTIEREPIFSMRGTTIGGNDFGNTYVEIDLTNQHLYYYKEGQMLMDSPIVTGNVARGHSTPSGLYKLRGRMRNVVLRGRGYAAPVSYWMPFNGGIGLHDARWRSNFGGEIYRTGGSHGCVNMPKESAKILYENIETGCPIVCYKTEVRATTTVAEFQATQLSNGM